MIFHISDIEMSKILLITLASAQLHKNMPCENLYQNKHGTLPSSRGVMVSTTDRHRKGHRFKPGLVPLTSESEIHGEIRCLTTLAVDGRTSHLWSGWGWNVSTVSEQLAIIPVGAIWWFDWLILPWLSACHHRNCTLQRLPIVGAEVTADCAALRDAMHECC